MKIQSTVALSAALTGLLLFTQPGSGAAPKFYPDDPIWLERDHQDASATKPWSIDLGVDIIYGLFARPGDPTPNVRAKNVNTVDEVPDSSWFVNRAGLKPVSAQDVATGPDTTPGPSTNGAWTVTSSKSDGVTPGFTIRDASGQVWFLKFDAPGHRGMATGTEVAVTKLLWALGYHVPETHIAFLRPDRLVVGEAAKFTPVGGTARPMESSDVANLLKRADKEKDGSYRVIASKALPKIGEFRFYDTHPDDPNDIVPHEHRRELRGFRVFAAWLNHVDVKGKNTLDALIKEDGRAVIRHYLQDFGSTLGSASVAAHEPWEGSDYLADPGYAWKQVWGFGFIFPGWHTIDFFESPTVGRLPRDNTKFNPDSWKPRVPNPAFERARADDKFWAARKLAAVTDDMVRAAVKAGAFDDDRSEEFLVKALAERRDAIIRTYLPAVNPISDPSLTQDGLTFENTAVARGVANAPAGYRAAWFVFDNATHESRAIQETTGTTTRLAVPANLPDRSGVYIKVELSASGGSAAWEAPVHAYFQRQQNGWRLVGFERVPQR